jgi:NAD(P)-dependent dehydrogenase (short-subunit alcohol dehydrogenase family)
MLGRATFDYGGTTAIVTGSTKGIGRGIAGGLADAGANVVVNARTAADVDRVAAELDRDAAGTVIGVAGDMTDPDDVESLVDTTVAEFDRVDLLVNNAAVWPDGPMPEVGLEEWDFGLGVNARGAFYASTLVARHMIEADVEGSIVNVTSQAGERHGAGHGLYGVSKAAQSGLTWRMAHDLAEHGIRVNAVSTAQTDTYQLRKNYVEGKEPEDLTEAEIEAAKAERAAGIPLGRLGEPEDLADGVLFLASDRADYVTGHVLRVSGGKNLE